MLKQLIKSIRDLYIKNQAGKVKIPEFNASEEVRYHFIFKGRVQNVGFRLAMYEFAQRLELTGWVKNLYDLTVEAEIQGNKEKIQFLIESMKKLPQATVKSIEHQDMSLVEGEVEFRIIRE